ncbi:Multi-sensor Signal Transduction Histidine Kinase [Pedobacter sp. BAL39]|uniref:ATP-binding protein n=1 Tax=Pedobacter sp. BAL39 TaxID=391596 RepID=UPI0001559637|nr:ATP-binding protein [Pedobacter sp. BAL39]EDM36696.1 Multi-sensor Signal Transduction Histidine Kinase [Pedobacter sp. BAL39]
MNNYQVDLTNCDKEPIHIPGKIQSQGFLIAVDIQSYQVTYVSDNISAYVETSAGVLLNLHVSVLAEHVPAFPSSLDFEQLFKLGRSQDSFDLINPYKVLIGDSPFYLIIYTSGAEYVMEFEPITLDFDIQNLIGRSVSRILATHSLSDLLGNAALEVKQLIEYDRVMIYKFHDDGHGEVVAEVKNEELEPFFGLHYPASDIPQQARNLYKANLTRIIADVHSEDSRILTYEGKENLDLTHSGLRAVSPIHIQYLRNMGVDSSFSISLLSKGELWGLIACHNYTPRFIDYKAREGAKMIGNILSSALEYRQTEEDGEKDEVIKDAVQSLSTYLEKDVDLIAALTKQEVTLLQVTGAQGVAICFENEMYTVGETPPMELIEDLFGWLRRNMQDSVYHTSQLPEVYRAAAPIAAQASGILACMLSKEMGELVVWFKPEQLKTIHWAGNPEKNMEPAPDGTMVLSPRHSFESWAQLVKNTSAKWTAVEITAVLRLREKILYAVNKKASEIRILNERLKMAYEELDTFSYTVSHDLRTPLTTIKSYTELFLAQNTSLDDKGKMMLDRVVSGADKMTFLISEILKLARVGRSDIDFSKINMSSLINGIVEEVTFAQKSAHVDVQIGDCPELSGDQTLLSQAFTNIIGNAVKYSAKSENPKVSINGTVGEEEIIYSIRDNGIGIDINHHDKVFELFKRMENVKDYEGTGVGLAIVKRILEKHHGRIWFDSELGTGTVFYMAFKK